MRSSDSRWTTGAVPISEFSEPTRCPYWSTPLRPITQAPNAFTQLANEEQSTSGCVHFRSSTDGVAFYQDWGPRPLKLRPHFNEAGLA
jgi:hypothetical protein